MRLCLYVRKKVVSLQCSIKRFENMKEVLQHFREQPKETIKEVAMCVMIFAVCGASAILQGCTVTKGTTVRGKATIVTTDTTVVKHNGTLKFKKSMFNN